MSKKYKVLDLFAGAGGFSLGFKTFNIKKFHPFEIVGAVEYDKGAAKTLISAFKRQGIDEKLAEEMVINKDITLSETKKLLYEQVKEVDIIIGGPPCQSFSTIGPRSGDKRRQAKFANDERDSLFEHYLEIVRHYQPLFVVFENVTGLKSKKNGDGEKYIDVITRKFEELGYDLTIKKRGLKNQKYMILNAADYGVPQQRERIIIIGNRLGIKNPYPKPTHCPPDLAKKKCLLPYVTLKDAIGDLPPVIPKITLTPPQKGLSKKDISREKIKQIEELNKERDNGLDEREYHWDEFNKSYKRGNKSTKKFLRFIKPKSRKAKLIGHIARGQQESDIKLFAAMEPGTSSRYLLSVNSPLLELIKYDMNSFYDKYKKLSWDRPCTTIFAHMQKDGNRFIHPDTSQARTLTVREAARIQSFPDDYIIEAIGNTRYKYIGNAVPPLLAMAIAKAIYKALETARKTGESDGYKITGSAKYEHGGDKMPKYKAGIKIAQGIVRNGIQIPVEL